MGTKRRNGLQNSALKPKSLWLGAESTVRKLGTSAKQGHTQGGDGSEHPPDVTRTAHTALRACHALRLTPKREVGR